MKKIFTSILILSGFIAAAQSNSTDELWKWYNSHDFQRVIEKAKPMLVNDPDNADFNLMIGQSYADLSKFKDAIPYLEATVKNDSNNSWRKAWALNYLGTCYFMLQRYDDSEKSINACITLNATRNATNDAYGKSLLFGFNAFYKGWKTFETANFRFHFQNMNDDEIGNFISVREKAFIAVNDFFKSTLPKKIDFFVWASGDDAKNILRTDLGFAKPYYCIIHSHFNQTPGHEITHVLSNYSTSFGNKTRFINEGTAVCFDQTHQDRLSQVKDWCSTNNQQVSIRDHWENGNKYGEEILYPVSGLFVEELIHTFGRDKFIRFFGNQTYDNAKTVYGNELDKVIYDIENKINL